MKNIILLTVDTLRKDSLGIYNDKENLTPFLDSLMNHSLVFTRFHSSGPYTQASFPGILTSSYYLEYGRPQKLSPRRVVISEALQKANITTAAFHSNPYLSDYFGWNRGWDVFYDSMQDEVSDMIPYVRGDQINQKVKSWLDRYIQTDSRKPFFLWTHYMDVHEPYVPKKQYLQLVDSSISMSEQEMFDLFKNTLLKRDTSNPQLVHLLHKLYRAGVRETDDYIKDFFNILQQNQVLENSIIIFTTDHGDEFGEHKGLSHDGKFYSELVDSPFMIIDFDQNQKKTCHNLVSNLDIAPTILHLFDIPPEEKFEGQSLLPIDRYQERGVFGEAIGKTGSHEKPTDLPVYYYRENNIKIIYYQDQERWEIYDLELDPAEQNNLIHSYPRAGELKEKLLPRVNRWENR
ncbi:MAG: sulfatase [Candidatus Atribacteria bacterium]|nr:sulfatase [Candidatus Atribacteria bacterium]